MTFLYLIFTFFITIIISGLSNVIAENSNIFILTIITFLILFLGLFLVSGLFAEWKKVEIPAKLAAVVEEAYDNEECRITKLTDGSIEVWFQKDDTVVVFETDDAGKILQIL